MELFQTSHDGKDDRREKTDGSLIEVSVDKSGNRSAVEKKFPSKRTKSSRTTSSSSSSSSSTESSSSSSKSNAEKVVEKQLLKLRRITKRLRKAGIPVTGGGGEVKDASNVQGEDQQIDETPSSSSKSTQPQRDPSNISENPTQSESTSSKSKQHRREPPCVSTKNVNQDLDAPKFIVRTKDDVCRMIVEFDRSHGGQSFRQDLVNMCAQNQQSEPCKFYNIGLCKSTNKFAHFIGGKEVNHVCSDCELVVPGLGALHKAESRECPIYLTMQYD